MYTIIMKPNKALIASSVSKIYQRENAVDKIQILLPPTYDEIELKNFLVTLKYVDQQRVAQSETLVLDEELYKDTYLRYTLPITTEITRFAGDITFFISAVKVDPDTQTQYVLHSGEYTMTVCPLADLYNLVSDESLDAIDQKMAELSAKIEALDIMSETYDKNQVDDLQFNDGLLQVSAKGEVKGNGVIIQNSETDDDSNPDDAVLNLSELRTVTL